MNSATLRVWYLVHKWTSLISTLFLLLLCLTGLPLIFHDEIEHYFDPHPELAEVSADAPGIDYDQLIAKALAARPGEVLRLIAFDRDDPRIGALYTAPSLLPPPRETYA